MQMIRNLWDMYWCQYGVILFSEHYLARERFCGILSVRRGKKAADKVASEATAKLREGKELYNSWGSTGREVFTLKVKRIGKLAWDWDHYFTEPPPSVLRDR